MELIKSVNNGCITKVTHTFRDPVVGEFECIEYIDESGIPFGWVLQDEEGEFQDEILLEEVKEILF